MISSPLQKLLAATLLASVTAGAFAQATPPSGAAPGAAPVVTPPLPDQMPQPTSTQPTSDTARDALGKQAGDVDQSKLLKDTLTATDKQYSLIRKGKFATTYDLNYQYIGSQTIDIDLSTSTLTGITTTRGHMLTNTVSTDYGLADNLTGNVTIPLVSRYSQGDPYTGLSNAFGDVSLGARYQPFSMGHSGTAYTGTATLRLPTGRSPFKGIDGQGTGTGAGFASLALGANASKILDPVALFGAVNLTLGAPAAHLSQIRGEQTLTEVHPGPALGIGGGFAYALSYDVSTTFSFQEAISNHSRLDYFTTETGAPGQSNTASQVIGTFNFGLGVRMSPQTTVNFSVGIGLTSDSPDFTLDMNVPLNF